LPVAAVAARKVSVATADRWLQARTADFAADTPVWLVGLYTGRVAVRDVVRVPGVDSTDARQAVGAFYVWDASRGATIYEGALMTADEFAAVGTLPETAAAIRPATEPAPIVTLDRERLDLSSEPSGAGG
jgi:hypothetical protein